ncbi:hypothetical protein AB1Y20_012522 [Prymnesium parvum]|uniref:Uncharacterized protein n=1 Tax=Prymnesium parvum TaxID=97485 RepID=A0AB34IJM7_PRYPA
MPVAPVQRVEQLGVAPRERPGGHLPPRPPVDLLVEPASLCRHVGVEPREHRVRRAEEKLRLAAAPQRRVERRRPVAPRGGGERGARADGVRDARPKSTPGTPAAASAAFSSYSAQKARVYARTVAATASEAGGKTGRGSSKPR